MNNIVKYQNGNYTVTIDLTNGTKIRENNLDFFKPDFPESMDVKICDRCDMCCEFCHENSTPDGKIGDIMSPGFIDRLHPYTEIAIGGGNPLEHPDLVPFLEKCKSLKLIPSMTVNQVHFMKNINFIESLVNDNLIYGLGVSLVDPSDEFISTIQQFPNAVIHVINGIHGINTLTRLMNKNLKILILGYKEFRRGKLLYDNDFAARVRIEGNKDLIYAYLPEIINDEWFKVVSFDNLAIKQLDPHRFMNDDKWNEFFMGEDGLATMYVDMVKQEFAVSSTSTERYSIEDDIVTMFNKIRTDM